MRRERSEDREAGPRDGQVARLCAVGRVQRPADALIRFVPTPDGGIAADLARRLPGRGVWVTADRSHVAQAVRAKAFQRSLKRQIAVPGDLPAVVESLMERRVGDAFSLANKAGLVVTGFERIAARLTAGDVTALMHGTDAAADGRNRLDAKWRAIGQAAGSGAADTVVSVLTIDQMSLALGRPNVVHAALIKGGATERLLMEAGRLGRFRSGIGHSEVGENPAIQGVGTDNE
ncbi:MAG: RNA-binding protein [Hyphomicrobiaceae bacterium]